MFEAELKSGVSSRFPYLNEFASLVGKTMLVLKDKGVSIVELRAVIEHSYRRNGNKLIDHGSWRKLILSAKHFECLVII